MMRKITGIELEQQPSIALLNDVQGDMPRQMKCLLYFMLLAAKITIARATLLSKPNPMCIQRISPDISRCIL